MIISALRACRATLTPLAGAFSAVIVVGASVAATAAVLTPNTPSVSPHPLVTAAPPAGVLPPRRVAPPQASRSARTAVKTVPVGASFTGRASWYGAELHGNRTANGERFDMHELTAASRTLPFGTRLNVCLARSSDRCVIVRINDRGPYVDGRVLDLSAAARRALGFGGVARVTATPVERRTVLVRTAAPPVRTSGRQGATPFGQLPSAVRAANEPPRTSLAGPVRSSGRSSGSSFGQVTVPVAALALLLLLAASWAPRLSLPTMKEFPWSSRWSARRLA